MTGGPTVLQRCDQFVGRTMNWLYDHLRSVPRYVPIILTDQLANRVEFPLLEARHCDSEHMPRRVWRKLSRGALYPLDRFWLRRRHPALLHSHFGYVAVADRALQAHLDVPWIVAFYGADVYQLGRLEAWRERYARLFEQVAVVLALGPKMADELCRLGCPASKIAVHALGVDVATLPSRPRVLQHGAQLRLLFAGTFREKKGIEYVVRAAARARQRGVRLHLTLLGDAFSKAGDWETKQSIFRQIETRNLEGAVTHRPFVSFRELVALALESHLFVAPSVTAADGDSEGTPFVLQQMMATGMPAIATTHSDIPFLFGDHKDLLVPERDTEAIADRLEQYAIEPERLLVDGRALEKRMRTAFDVRICAARLADGYDALRATGRWTAGSDAPSDYL